ncbi:hypothetical protein DFJ74DRAFT_682735 [Hyaloraphidium curvatum]|nr:hypothetical protein DFJ74DRAFT_682735 [Hyaloraphidium curvatum]
MLRACFSIGRPRWAFMALAALRDALAESNVLGRFPLPLRRALIDSVASSLLSHGPLPIGSPVPASEGPLGAAFLTPQQWAGLQASSSWLTAPAHVWWAMEVVGQGFALPVDEFHRDVVEKCLAVYSGWILGNLALGEEPISFRDGGRDDGLGALGAAKLSRALTSCRPWGARAENPLAAFQPPGLVSSTLVPVTQWFLETCFKHLSQLFQPRTPAFGYAQAPLPPEMVSAIEEASVLPGPAPVGTGAEESSDAHPVGALAASKEGEGEVAGASVEPAPLGSGDSSLREASSGSPLGGTPGPLFGPGTDMARHADLCKTLLAVLGRCVRAYAELNDTGNALTDATWTTLLKCLFAAADVLMSTSSPLRGGAKQDNVEGDLGDLLAQDLLRTLLEIWLRAGAEVSTDLWAELKGRFPTWALNRTEPLQHWTAASVGLTSRILSGLDSGAGGRAIVIKYGDGTACTIDRWLGKTSVAQTLQDAWWRVLNLVDNPAYLPADQFTLHCLGVSKLVDLLLHTSASKDLAVSDGRWSSRPDSNTLIAMFGSWIWTSIARPGGWEFEEGRSLSHATMIRIIAAPQHREPIKEAYLERFYVALVDGLTKGDVGVVTSIMVNLATRGLGAVFKGGDGARFVIPELVLALGRILPDLQPTFTKPPTIPVDELRRACFQILGSTYAMVNEFSSVLLERPLDAAGQSPPPLPPRQWEREAAVGGIRPRLLSPQTSSESFSKPREAAAFLRQWYETQQRGLTGVVKGAYARARMVELNLDLTKGFHDLPATMGLLKPLLLSMALQSLVNEQSPVGCRYLLNIIDSLVFEEFRQTPEILLVVGRTVLEKIAILRWPDDVTCAALDLLSRFTVLAKTAADYAQALGREIIHTLAILVERLLENENLVPHRQVIIRSIDCATKCALLGQWILFDRDCSGALIATYCRAMGILNPEDDFGAVDAVSDASIPNPWGSLNAAAGQSSPPSGTSQALANASVATDMRDASQSLLAPAALQSGFGERIVNVTGGLVQSVVDLGAVGRKHSKSKADGPARPRVPSGLVQLPTQSGVQGALGLNPGSILTAGVSSSTQDGGVGMPSFAIQQAMLLIKISAEIALHQFIDFCGSFPPYGEATGVSCLGSLWDERQALRRQAGILPSNGGRHSMDRNSGTESDIIMDSLRKHLRVYAVDNRVLVSVIDEPPIDESFRTGTSATLILRDAGVKNSWTVFLNYGPAGVRGGPAEDQEQGNEANDLFEETVDGAAIIMPTLEPVPGDLDPNSNASRSGLPLSLAAVNELAIPSLNDLATMGGEDAQQVDLALTSMSAITSQDVRFAPRSMDNISSRNAAVPASVPTQGKGAQDAEIPQAARLVLTHLGFLSIANQRRQRVVPLVVSESLCKDLEKLDRMPERECVRAAVLFARNGLDGVDEMLNNQSVSEEFVDFLHGLGWAVDPDSHPGYLASLDARTCKTALYYATRTVEAVFHVPYTLKQPPAPDVPGVQSSTAGKPESSRRSVMRSLFHHLGQEDLVYIVWIEDINGYLNIPKHLGRGHFFIFVQPLPGSPGLYVIRLHSVSIGTSLHSGGPAASRSATSSADDPLVSPTRLEQNSSRSLWTHDATACWASW